jgi:hypothetical protein
MHEHAVGAADSISISGGATETTLGTRLSESDFDTKVGSLTESAPASDTASSGLNGRLQRLAQRLTSLIGLFPSALTGSGNFKVALSESTASQAVTGTVTVTQSTATNLKVDASGVAVPVTDNSGSLTVDAPVGTPVFVRLSDGSSAIATLAVSLASLPALAAGTSLIGLVSASAETSTIYNGSTALTPKFAKIAASSSGDNTLVSAVVGKKLRVLAYNFMANGTVNAKFQSGAAGTDLTGLKYCVVNTGICAPFNPAGWFETASNTLLNLNLSGAIAVGGELVYVEV